MLQRTRLFFAFIVLAISVAGQSPVDPTARYHRVIALVHLQGGGGKDEPKRPEYVPAVTSREGIVAWAMQVADDGKMALVQLVAVDRQALEPILNDKRPDVRVFEIGRAKKGDIEKELKKFKKDFDLSSFQVVAQ